MLQTTLKPTPRIATSEEVANGFRYFFRDGVVSKSGLLIFKLSVGDA
jgi:hypothetical protein